MHALSNDHDLKKTKCKIFIDAYCSCLMSKSVNGVIALK